MASCFQNWRVTQASRIIRIRLFIEHKYKKQTKILLQDCIVFCNFSSLAMVLGKFKHLFPFIFNEVHWYSKNCSKLLNKNCKHQFTTVQNELNLEFLLSHCYFTITLCIFIITLCNIRTYQEKSHYI